MSNISTLDKPLKFNRKREGGQQRAEQDSNRSQPISRNQDIEQVQELCKDFSTLPVQNIRELLNDLVHRKRLPVWDSKSTRFATVASADKKTLCRYLKMHLLLPVEEMDQVRELCSTLNKESVVNLRKMYTEIMPSTNVKASSLTKDKLCQTLSQALSTGQVHKISTFDRDNEYEKIIENDDAVDLPEWSKDAVSGELMIQPVVLANGQSYDRSTIVGCIKSANPKCPLTRKPITSFEPNVMLTQAIEQWLMQHFGVSLDILHKFRLQKEQEQRLKGVPAALQARIVQEEKEQEQVQINQDAQVASLLQPQSDDDNYPVDETNVTREDVVGDDTFIHEDDLGWVHVMEFPAHRSVYLYGLYRIRVDIDARWDRAPLNDAREQYRLLVSMTRSRVRELQNLMLQPSI